MANMAALSLGEERYLEIMSTQHKQKVLLKLGFESATDFWTIQTNAAAICLISLVNNTLVLLFLG